MWEETGSRTSISVSVCEWWGSRNDSNDDGRINSHGE